MHIAPYLASFMVQHPDLTIEMHLTDEIVDIVGEGMDLAIRIAELNDSSLVARKLAPCRRVICATPNISTAMACPQTPADLAKHTCLSPNYQHVWRLSGPNGARDGADFSRLRSNSGDVLHRGAAQRPRPRHALDLGDQRAI